MNCQPDHRRPALRLVFVVVLTAAGCSRTPNGPAPAAAPQADPAVVEVVSPERAAIQREVSQPGFIEAFEETAVYAKVGGYVKEGWKDIGARLHKGEILAELWVPEREVELRQKEALVRQAEAEIKQARQASATAQAASKSAEAKVVECDAKWQSIKHRFDRMKSQYTRMSSLRQVLTKENVEEAELGFKTATANLTEAEAAVNSARAILVESKSRWRLAEESATVAEHHLRVAQEDRAYARTQLDYARLPAPYDCVVTRRYVNTRDFVASATTGKGKPLYVVQRVNLLRVVVQVPENEVEWIRARTPERKGTAARIRIPRLKNQTFAGDVARISWSLDSDTRTLRAEIDLSNPEGRLRPGMYVYATLSAALPDVLTLPRSAVATEGEVTRGYQSYCYQVLDGKVRRLRIELGAGDSERVEVRKKQTKKNGSWEAFSGKEQIVQGNLSEVREGQAVIVRPRKP